MLIMLLGTVTGLNAGETQEYYYAIEQDGVVCGYAHVLISPTEFDSRPATELLDSVWMVITAMGKEIKGTYIFHYDIDPVTDNYFHHTSIIDQESINLAADMTVIGDSIYIVSLHDHDTSTVALPPNIILQNTRLHRHLLSFFVDDTLNQKECEVFSEVDGLTNTVQYTKIGRESKAFANVDYDALGVRALNRTTGIQIDMWVDAATGLLLLVDHPVRKVYLTTADVIGNMKAADLDDKLFVKVDTVITNPWALSYLKARARLQPGGMWITPEDLNVPGQSFAGTVKDNLIDGVFEISHKKYDGTKAPPFPPDFSTVDSLKAFLESTEMIESDDSILILKARELTEGSTDSWDALKKLSRWVNTEIGYDLPGGISALKTYETRLGECGSHSNLLAAFCRAVGIPARVVFGCMYVPDHGGAFGQHAWNEVYMGESGWIPIESTAEEIDYADCGHIRLGQWKSMAVMFNPIEMEIIDFQISEEARSPESAKRYDPFVGKYHAEQNILTVLVQNGSLALDIPGQMVYELKAPDENGDWYFKLTNRVSVSFVRDSTDTDNRMVICSRQRLPRSVASDTIAIADDIPEQYRPFIGVYTVPMQNVNFDILFTDNSLLLVLPGNHQIPLAETETAGEWKCDVGTSSSLIVSFETDESGKASAMNYRELTVCTRQADTD